jgi:hypothetical protein
VTFWNVLWPMAKFSGTISVLLKQLIILRQILHNVLKQLDFHHKSSSNVSLGEKEILDEVAPHQLLNVTPHLLWANTEPPCFGRLLACKANILQCPLLRRDPILHLDIES